MNSGSPAAVRSVLVVDDDPVSLAVAGIILESEGCTVLAAGSGEEALALLDSGPSDPPDCILADLRMPSLSGVTLARRLRQAAPQALLLAMSATPPREAKGYDGILKKPLTPETLHAAFAQRPSAGNGSASSADGSAYLDAEIFARLRAAMPRDGLEEIFNVFLSDTRTRIAAMREADPETVRREAHTVKGGAAMVGARQVSLAAAAVESGIDDPGARLRKLDEMEAHCRSTEIILKKRLKA